MKTETVTVILTTKHNLKEYNLNYIDYVIINIYINILQVGLWLLYICFYKLGHVIV